MNEYSPFDPETRAYMRRIVLSLFVTLVWMMTQAIAGLYFRLAIIENTIQPKNLIYYLFLLVSLFFYLRYLYRLWKQHL